MTALDTKALARRVIELEGALERLSEIVGVTLDKDFGFWSSPAQNERRSELFTAWKHAHAALTIQGEGI